MSIRDKVLEALRTSGISEDFITNFYWGDGELRAEDDWPCEQLLASPGIVSLEIGYRIEDYPSYKPKGKRPIFYLIPVVSQAQTPDGSNADTHWGVFDLAWNMSPGTTRLILQYSEENPGLSPRKIFDKAAPEGSIHILTLTLKDLTKEVFEEVRKHWVWLYQISPETVAWYKGLAVPDGIV